MKYIVFTLATMTVTSFIPAVADPPPFQAELVPTEDGYQVQWPSRLEFEAVDDNDGVIGQASRPVHIIPNSPPVVTITGEPESPSATEVEAEFSTTVTDPDGDEVRWVEFYDNGVLMGRDAIEPFGDKILDASGELLEFLWKGPHSITARAFDSKGAGGPLSEPYEVDVTGGNSQPQATVSSTTLHNGILTLRFDASDPDGTADIASVVATNLRTKDTATAQYPQGSYPYNAIYMQLAGLASGPHSIAVVAVDQAGARSYLALTEVVVPGPPPPSGNSLGATLAAVIADDSTLTVSNALYTGEPLASGVFSGGLPRGLQMDEGVAMTTGEFDSWNKGNIAVDTTEDWGLPGDEQLYLRVLGRDTWDAAILEFDVYSPNGQLVIEHQLGSEEYYEFVDRFNDAFAVFVNGVPVSLLPDAADIVAVHSVNDWRNRHLYLDNPLEIRPDVDPAYRDSMVEYDGLTIRLRANALVAPGQTYRVRIVIADVNDFILDSAVFLEKDSLKSIQPQP